MTFRPRPSHALLLALALVASMMPLTARATPGPGASPGGSPAPVTLVPEVTTVTIGVADASLMGRLPLVIAEARGYFGEAGFLEVQVIEAQEPLPGLLDGSLDLAILDARQAAGAHALGLPVHAVAGHRVVPLDQAPVGSPAPASSASPPSESPWASLDLVVATADTVSARPGTIAAFTMAYIRALQDLGARVRGIDPGVSPGPGPAASGLDGDPILQTAAAAGLEVTPELLATWPAPLGSFLPFDGGFDDPTLGDGLGSLRNRYLDDLASMPDLGSFVVTRTLHAAQQALGLAPDPPDGATAIGSPVPSPVPAP